MTKNRDDRPGSHVNPSGTETPSKSSDKLNFTELAQANTAALKRAINSHVPNELHKAHPKNQEPFADITAEEMLKALLKGDRFYLNRIANLLVDQHIGLIDFYERLLSPVIAELGNLWRSDELGFVNVELATIRLQMMCNQFSERHASVEHHACDPRSIMLARARGERHMLGLSIVDMFFRESGWRVDGGASIEITADFFMRISNKKYDFIGISIGASTADDIDTTIKRIKAQSLNPNVKVALGGPAISQASDRFSHVGADLISTDIRNLVKDAGRLVEA